MEKLLNKIALKTFDIIAAKRGFTFKQVETAEEMADINHLYAEEGFSFPDELKPKVIKYKKSTINFIAYHNKMAVGMVRLSDPNVINRPYELYGVDEAGKHYEIQSLVVKKKFRDGTQFVMLGLFKEMYEYSRRNSILYWNSCGARNVYMTMRRYCKEIQQIDIDFDSIRNPLTQFLFTKKIIETYFTMEVDSFEPWKILKKFLRHSVRNAAKSIQVPELSILKNKRYESLSYGGK